MPLVQYVVTALLCQVEDFPAVVPVEGKDEPRKFERSCEGALHVRPGGTAEITADELAHLREKHPKVAAAVRILATDEQLATSRAAATEPPPAPAPTEPPDEGDSGSGGGDDEPTDESPKGSKKSGKR